MIYRKIFKIETVGRRGTNLRPKLFDDLPRGINAKVLEYVENDKYAIVECWCSDHPLLKNEEQKMQVDLEQIAKHPAVTKVLASHPKSPAKIGRIAISKRKENTEIIVDEVKKEITFKGRKGKYKEKKEHSPHGKPEELYILDEG